ncbi:hypothetical protein DSC45_33030 [Streptomyces sp. YIM 130001]|uniref:hypothetical protein n=1 Tax=Streptomyces sp. YIM 130001 TaxID=2259644 RepID=UPI000E656CE2|nr:hypothetical protein [Streptomyces sp. YIM 130001]RII08672.1 hypothetical protein DSC45_33030 [Streptomyces sp. YIM 130001]
MTVTAPSNHRPTGRRRLRIATLVAATGMAAGIAVPASALAPVASPAQAVRAAADSSRTYTVGESTVRLDAERTSATVTNNDGTADITLTPKSPGPRTALDGWTYKLFVPAGKPDANPPYVSATFTDDSGEAQRKKLSFPASAGKSGTSEQDREDRRTTDDEREQHRRPGGVERIRPYTFNAGESVVQLDAEKTAATVTDGDGTRSFTLTPAAAGARKSGDGWTWKLFVPAGKPDANPPYVYATFEGRTMATLYFTANGKKPAAAATSSGADEGAAPHNNSAPQTRDIPQGSVDAGAHGADGSGIKDVQLAAGGGAAAFGAAGLGFVALRRRGDRR